MASTPDILSSRDYFYRQHTKQSKEIFELSQQISSCQRLCYEQEGSLLFKKLHLGSSKNAIVARVADGSFIHCWYRLMALDD